MIRFTLLIPLTLAGCVSIEKIAPPVNVLVETGSTGSYGIDSLERGRMVYLNQCAACHTAEPVNRYTLSHWDKILPEMNEEARLSAAQAADVAAYIRAAHGAMSRSGPAQ